MILLDFDNQILKAIKKMASGQGKVWTKYVNAISKSEQS